MVETASSESGFAEAVSALIGPDGVKDETFLKMTGKDSEGVMASYPKDTSTLPMYKPVSYTHLPWTCGPWSPAS